MTLSEIKPMLERMSEIDRRAVNDDRLFAEWKLIKDRLNEALAVDGFQVVYNSGLECYSLVVKR